MEFNKDRTLKDLLENNEIVLSEIYQEEQYINIHKTTGILNYYTHQAGQY